RGSTILRRSRWLFRSGVGCRSRSVARPRAPRRRKERSDVSSAGGKVRKPPPGSPDAPAGSGPRDSDPDTDTRTLPTPLHAYLLAIDVSSSESQRFFVLDQPEQVIGRAATCAIRLNDDGVSRSHARILLEGGDYILEDLGSVNGTFLNGAQIEGRFRLRS